MLLLLVALALLLLLKRKGWEGLVLFFLRPPRCVCGLPWRLEEETPKHRLVALFPLTAPENSIFFLRYSVF